MNNSDNVVRRLIELAQSGDPTALGELLNRYRAFLNGIAHELLNDRAAARIDASDITQQTCLSAHKKITEFDGRDPAQFVAWLRQIHERNIRNVARDQLQTAKRAVDREQRYPDNDAIVVRQTSPSQRAIRKEEAGRLAVALERLPDDERRALQLRYLEGRTLAEVSDAMGLTTDGLVWLMKRAMKKIKLNLGDAQS
jgi:RNA polymerase sigma-70 factor, ECF subfamily